MLFLAVAPPIEPSAGGELDSKHHKARLYDNHLQSFSTILVALLSLIQIY